MRSPATCGSGNLQVNCDGDSLYFRRLEQAAANKPGALQKFDRLSNQVYSVVSPPLRIEIDGTGHVPQLADSATVITPDETLRALLDI
jgi:hypothetical protein